MIVQITVAHQLPQIGFNWTLMWSPESMYKGLGGSFAFHNQRYGRIENIERTAKTAAAAEKKRKLDKDCTDFLKATRYKFVFIQCNRVLWNSSGQFLSDVGNHLEIHCGRWIRSWSMAVHEIWPQGVSLSRNYLQWVNVFVRVSYNDS